MLPFLEITDRCVKCDNCRLICPEDSIKVDSESYHVDTWSCTLCNICVEVCPIDCIKLIGDQS